MSKKFIIGMIGIALGAALVGGVAGYFIPHNKTAETPNNGNSQVQVDENYEVYELPEALKMYSFTTYEVNENVSLFSCNGMNSVYVLDKITGKFSWLFNGTILDLKQISDSESLISISNGGLCHFNSETLKVTTLLGFEGYSVEFFDYESDCGLFVKSYNSSGEYKLSKLNEESFEVEEEFSINSQAVYNTDKIFDVGNYYCLAYVSRSFGGYMCFIDKTTREMTMLEYGMTDGSYVLRDNKMYYHGYFNDYGYICLDLETKERTLLFVYGMGFVDFPKVEYENGFMVFNPNSSVATFFSYEDNSTQEFSWTFYMNVAGHDLILSSVFENSAYYGIIGKFNSETLEIEELYRFSTESGEQKVFNYAQLDGKHIIQCNMMFSGWTGFIPSVEVKISSDGELTFETLSLNCVIAGDSETVDCEMHQLADGVFLVFAEINKNVYYYDANKDFCKYLLNGEVDFEASSMKDGIVEIFTTNGFKYEFDTQMMTVLCVGYVVEK